MKKFGQPDKQQPSLFFDSWAGDAQVFNVFHGTLSEFKKFDITKSDPDNYFGPAFYFSNDPEDVGENYANKEGADVLNRINIKFDELYDEITIDQNEELAEQLGIKDINNLDEIKEKIRAYLDKKHRPSHERTMRVYVKMKKPVILAKNSPRIWTLDYTNRGDGLSGNGKQLLRGLKKICDSYNIPFDKAEGCFITDLVEGGMSWAEVLDTISSCDWLYAYDDNTGRYIPASHMFRKLVESMGYDGIIKTAHDYLPYMKGVKEGTIHYVVWNPRQIKSSLSNTGIYNPKSTDITAKNEATLVRIASKLDDLGYYKESDYLVGWAFARRRGIIP